MIQKPKLDCKEPVGNGVYCPEYQNGATILIKTKTADMSGGHMLETTASTENLSAKFKNPRVKQDVPAEGRNQYM